jgi:hypothetical protein
VSLKIISVLLFVIGFFEIVGLAYYIDAVSQSTSTACCGIISYDDFADGAACNSSDITGSVIERTTDDEGNVWCTVNGTVCGARTLDSGLTTTLSSCFNESGHDVSSLCSAEALETIADDAETVPVVLTGFVLTLLMASTLTTILSIFGCCKHCRKWREKVMASDCCRSDQCATRLMLFNVCFSLTMWVILWIVGDVWMDSIIEDGYALDSVDSITGLLYGSSASTLDDIADDVDAACDLDGFSWDEGFIWVNYEMDTPSYLTSGVYGWTNAFGFSLGVIELIMFIKIQCLNLTLWEHDKEQKEKERMETEGKCHVQETTA